MQLVSLYTHLDHVGGANSLCIDLHWGLMDTGFFTKGKVGSFTAFNALAPLYKKKLPRENYLKLKPAKPWRKAEDTLIISHHRKITTLLLGNNKFLQKNLKIIHIAHVTLHSLRTVTLFPKTVIAVSQAVQKNLASYFKVQNSQVIYNGIKPPKTGFHKSYTPDKIRIVLAGTVNDRKQQLQLVQFLKGKLNRKISLCFAGGGPQLETLKQAVKGRKEFEVLGHVEDTDNLYAQSDYVLLFSKSEGLPLSLIEAQSHGVPLICNEVGGSLEILAPDKNGFLTNSLSELLQCFNHLPQVDEQDYQKMRKNSLQTFADKFRFKKMITAYLDLARDLCQK